MHPFSTIISIVIVGIFLIDRIFISSSKVKKSLSVIYFFMLIFIWFISPFEILAKALNVGRPVDILIYISLIVLIREFFLSRQRSYEQKEQITILAREIALLRSKKKASTAAD